jgi:hypothetical protein
MERTDEIARLITEWRTGVSEHAQRFDATRRAVDEVSVTETAAGGAIALTVGSSGIPTDLWLGDDVGRMKPARVAAEIMACLHRAQAGLADRVGVVVAGTMGDAAGAEAIVEEYRYRFPPPSDVDTVQWAENAGFGLPDTDIGRTSSPAVQDRPTAPARTKHRAPARDDDEDFSTPW